MNGYPMTAHRIRRASFLATAATALICVAPACSTAPVADTASDLGADVARLQLANAVLQRQIELAAGQDFYLVLDPPASRLTLMLKGARLQRYAVLGLQVGHPRVSWFGSRDPRHLQSVVWSHGELDPPRQIDRLVIQASEPGTGAGEPTPPPIPLTPEELYPVPSRYHVRFADGLSVEIRPWEADTTVGRWARLRAAWGEKWRDVVAALRSRNRDAIRLRIILNPKDAQSLYRSLPPSVRLLVLDGGNAAARPAA